MARRSGLALAAIDLLGSLFLVALVQMAPPPTPASAIPTFGVYAVTLTWPAAPVMADDLDLYLREPGGEIVFYRAQDGRASHLEHDDLGTTASGYGRVNNFERTVIRAVVPGEYTVTVENYTARTSDPVVAVVRLYRLSGRDELIRSQEVVLRRQGDEVTAFRFSVRADGTTAGFNRLPADLAGLHA